MFKPSGILTFTNYQGKTHLELEQNFAIEQQKRLMEFITSEPVKQIMKKIGEELAREYNK